MNGADRLCETLLINGVDVCFANPGTSEMHFVAALDRNPDMRCVLGLFEGVVTGAADGYGRMKLRPAANLLHTGPGLANGLANLHNARRAHTPVLNIVGDHASYHLALDAPLTSDIESLARPMSGFVRRISGPEDVGPGIEAALAAALAQPGVATAILPADAAWGEVRPRKLAPIQNPAPHKITKPTLLAAATAIRNAPGKVGLLLGGAALRDSGLAFAGAIAEACNAQLFTGVLISRIERGRGRAAVTRIPYAIGQAIEALKDITTLILIGEVEPVAFFAYPGMPSRLAPPECKIVTLATPAHNIDDALSRLADELGVGAAPRSRARKRAGEHGAPNGALTEDAISVILAQTLPDNAIICDEGLTSARRFFSLAQDAPAHDYLMNTGGSIGIGIPLAIGAALACPERKVITLQADGSALYTVQGLWTQARENLDVLTIIFANHAYAILQIELQNLGVNRIGRNAANMMQLDRPKIDWPGLAKSMGVEGARATTCAEFSKLLRAGLKRKGPFLIEAAL